MKYRGKNEIIAQILESANGNTVRLTKMYDVYVSHTVAKEYLTSNRIRTLEISL
jgi:predicted transcriptional regulator